MEVKGESLEYEIVRGGARINSELLFVKINQCLYTKKYTLKNGNERYSCYEDKNRLCKSSVVKKGDRVFAALNFNHTHPNHAELLKQFKFKNNLKRKASEITNLAGDQGRFIPLRSLYNQQMEK